MPARVRNAGWLSGRRSDRTLSRRFWWTAARVRSTAYRGRLSPLPWATPGRANRRRRPSHRSTPSCPAERSAQSPGGGRGVPAGRPAPRPRARRHGRPQGRHVGGVGGGHGGGPGHPGGVHHQVALGAGFPAVRRVGTGGAPKTARTLDESMAARCQSIRPAPCNRFSSTAWMRVLVLSACQAASRRRQDMPDPYPSRPAGSPRPARS